MSVKVALTDLIPRLPTLSPSPRVTSEAKKISAPNSMTLSEHHTDEPTSSRALVHCISKQSTSKTTEHIIDKPSTFSACVHRIHEQSTKPLINSAFVPEQPFSCSNSSSQTDIDSDVLPYHFVNVYNN